MERSDIEARFGGLIRVLMMPKITAAGKELDFFEGFDRIIHLIIEQCVEKRKKLMFIGNGGSAAIASHQALDFSLNCGIKATAFNDPCFLTCMANDFGYENVFAKQILPVAERGDILAAISSSGKSMNILKGVEVEADKCHIITMSGFKPNNPLRKKGDINIYVASESYRFVEACHYLYWDFILEMTIAERNKK